MALSKTTQDHEEIKQWAEARGGKPAEVASTERDGQTGILRIEFPKAKNANDSALKEISWEEFFEKFDASGLALVYQEQTADGDTSNFNKLVHPENVSASAKTSTKKAAPAKKTGQGAAKGAAAPAVKKSAGTAAKKTAGATNKAAAPAKKGTATSGAKTATKSTGAKKAATAKEPAKKAPAKKTAAKKTASSKR